MRVTENVQTGCLAALGVFCAVIVTAGALSAEQKPLSGTTISLGTYRGKQPTMSASVNGRPGLFLFDTGGGVTVVSPEIATASGCKPWGNITGFRMRGERMDLPRCDNLHFSVEGGTFVAPTAGVYDIMALAGPTAPHLDGSIALDIFSGKELTMDLMHHQLMVESKDTFSRRLRRATRVRIRLARDAEGLALEVYLGVATPSGMAWMVLDTGNDSSEIFLAKSIAESFGLDPKLKEPQPIKAVIAPGIILEGKARVLENMIMDGNIGVTFLQNWVLMLDLENARAWIAPAR